MAALVTEIGLSKGDCNFSFKNYECKYCGTKRLVKTFPTKILLRVIFDTFVCLGRGNFGGRLAHWELLLWSMQRKVSFIFQ